MNNRKLKLINDSIILTELLAKELIRAYQSFSSHYGEPCIMHNLTEIDVLQIALAQKITKMLNK